MQIQIADELVQGRQAKELEAAIREGLLLRDYLNADISLGKFAELIGMSYEEGRDWLHHRGIATLRRFNDPELAQAAEDNYRKLAAQIGAPLPGP